MLMDSTRSLKFNSKHQMDVGYKKVPHHKSFSKQYRAIQSSLSETAARTCHQKYCPKRIPNIGKYSGQSSVVAKLQAAATFNIQFTVKEIVVKPCVHFTRHFPKHSPRRFLRYTLRQFSQASPVPHFSFFHSPCRVLIIAFYYIFTSVLFATHYNLIVH